MSLKYLEERSAEEILTLWFTLHSRQWSKYAGDENNERLLREAASKFRLSLTAFDRSFSEIESRLRRSDGKTEADDLKEAAERERAREEEAARNVVLDRGFFEFAGGLSLPELQRLYFNDKSFRLKYTVLVNNYGYKVPPAPRGA